jgi:hypothetical protein
VIRENSKLFWVGIIITIAVCIYIYSAIGAQGVIELDKTEALQLQNLRFQAIAAQADLNDYVLFLTTKYQVSLDTHNLELETGRFTPIVIEVEDEE